MHLLAFRHLGNPGYWRLSAPCCLRVTARRLCSLCSLSRGYRLVVRSPATTAAAAAPKPPSPEQHWCDGAGKVPGLGQAQRPVVVPPAVAVPALRGEEARPRRPGGPVRGRRLSRPRRRGRHCWRRGSASVEISGGGGGRRGWESGVAHERPRHEIFEGLKRRFRGV